jgi:hypothetical protein
MVVTEELKVFRGIGIPVGLAATMKYAVLAKSGGGKTYCALKFEEQMCDAGMFFVVLDPVGKHWALRAGANGEERGGKRDVYVLGGLHGDVELSPSSGALIADTVVDHPGRYVLDVSTFESDAEQDRFATDFAKRLFRRKAKDPGYPLMLVLEEAESFIPQVPRGNQSVMLGAFGKIARQGRNHGLGLFMVAQRSAALNKGVLSQADVLIAKEMSHNRDLNAIDEWVEANGTKQERDTLIGSLASLGVDEAWVWSPSWLRCFTRTKVLRRTTFDSSASVEHGTSMKAVKLTPLNVAELGKHIAETAERSKAEDPRELRKKLAARDARITELQKLVEEQPLRVPEKVEVEVPMVPDEVLKLLGEAIGSAHSQAGRLEDLRTLARNANAARPTLAAERPVRPAPVRRTTPPPAPAPARHAPRNGAQADDGEAKPLKKAERAILAVLAQFPDGRTAKQLAMLTGYSPTSGGFNNALARLRSMELIDRGQPIRILPSGMAEIEGEYEPLPEGEALWGHWLSKLKLAERTILQALRSGDGLTSEQLAEATGYSGTSGGFNNALSRLRSLELIERGQPIVLSAEFAESVAA